MISFTDFNKNKLENGLYVVSTPIGNLSDISFRAIDVLSQSHFIVCEDTRVSKKLLEKYKIKNKLISNHKFNEKKNLEKLIGLLKSDKIVSLISDAGTPCVSDPGSVLVNEAIKENIKIYSVPGASSVAAAFSVSGFTGKYFFYGFFPEKKNELENDLNRYGFPVSLLLQIYDPRNDKFDLIDFADVRNAYHNRLGYEDITSNNDLNVSEYLFELGIE